MTNYQHQLEAYDMVDMLYSRNMIILVILEVPTVAQFRVQQGKRSVDPRKRGAAPQFGSGRLPSRQQGVRKAHGRT